MTSTGNIIRDVEQFLMAWVNAIQQSSLYGKNHALTEKALKKMHSLLTDILAGRDGITLGIIDQEMVFEKEPLYEFSRKRVNFIAHLTKMGISRIRFFPGITLDEISIFIVLMTFHIHSAGDVKLLKDVFDKKQIKHIDISNIQVEEEERFTDDVDNVDAFTKASVKKGLEFLEKTVEDIRKDKPVNGGTLKQIAAGLVNSLLMNKQLLLMMSSIKMQDEDLFMHNMHVCILTMVQAELLGLEHRHLVDIAGAALMHNIGYIVSGSDCLSGHFKAGYTLAESTAGARTLLRMKESALLSPIVAFENNMPYNNADIASKVYGDSLNIISMMITIACNYDAMRRDKSFYMEKGAESIYERMMEDAPAVYHPDLLNNFFSVLGKYPPGTLVELDTGEVGMVIQAGVQDVNRPQVELLYDGGGRPLEETTSVNLIEKDRHGRYRRSIVKSINPANVSIDHSDTLASVQTV
ncbi:hypothetical protein JXO52_16695 [bacterium]|nr:hypothetical protein [bacterium]